MKLRLILDPSKANPLAARIGRVILPDRSLLSPKQVKHAKRLETYLKKMDERGILPSQSSDFRKELADIARELGEQKSPTPRTILRARKKWIECGRQFHCLQRPDVGAQLLG